MEKIQAITNLKEYIKEGETLFTSVEHVSRSGMTRHIKVRQIKGDQPYDWSYCISKALGWKFNEKHHAITVQGCGMDMGFHLVSNLSRVLYGDDYAIKMRWL